MTLAQGNASAEDLRSKHTQKTYSILFRIDEHRIDTLFMGNGEEIMEMARFLAEKSSDTRYILDSVTVISSASQDGRLAYNISLSEKRAKSSAEFLKHIISDFPEYLIIRIPVGEDWKTFESIVENDTAFPSRNEALEIIRSDMDEDAKERKLRKLPGFFRYLIRNHVHELRAAHYILDMTVTEAAIDSLLPVRTQAATYTDRSMYFRKLPPEKKMIFALRTNLLVPALNIGVEVPVGNNWSVGADYYFPWWLSAGNDRCIQMLSWFVDTKYWFGNDRNEKDKLTGHALGMYAGFGYYDFQWLKNGYQGEFVDLGFDYTYAMSVANDKLRISFNIGLGWIHTVRRHYTPTDGYEELIKDPGIRHEKVNFFGPTRASVSITFPIRINSRKGGAR